MTLGASLFTYGDFIGRCQETQWERINAPLGLLGVINRLENGNEEIKYFDSYETKIWGLTAHERGVLSLDLRPALRRSDGVAGMYDTISGNFFESLGGRPFIAGTAIEGEGW